MQKSAGTDHTLTPLTLEIQGFYFVNAFCQLLSTYMDYPYIIILLKM